jgi:hypothetical protein
MEARLCKSAFRLYARFISYEPRTFTTTRELMPLIAVTDRFFSNRFSIIEAFLALH